MRIFHDISCARLRGSTCNCEHRTEYDPPAHYTRIDELDDLSTLDATAILAHAGGDGPIPPNVDKIIHNIEMELQLEEPFLRPFTEGEQIGMIKEKVKVGRLFDLPRGDFDKMMDRVQEEHRLLSKAQQRKPYTISRRPRGIGMHIQWHPEEKMFHVCRRDV